MGCLYGGKLSAVEGNEVHLVDVWQEHVDAIERDGLRMEDGGEVLVYDRLRAHSGAASVGPVDLAIVFVKSTLTRAAVSDNREVFGPGTLALTLQNGLGNIEEIAAVAGEGNVLAGTTAHGAHMQGPGRMRHAGSGLTLIGELDGRIGPRIQRVKEALEAAGMETQISGDVLGLVWDKLLVNVGINALTAITGLKNGELLRDPELCGMLEEAVREGAKVAEAKGIVPISRDPVAHAKDVARMTGENRSSMLQDVLAGRRTEIDMINGAIVEEGKRLGIPVPVNELLTERVHQLERERKEGS